MINVSFWNIAFTVINLLILFVAFRIFFFKPLQEIIDKRQAEADEMFNKAVEEEKQAEDLVHQYEDKLHSAEDEKKQIIAEARKKADNEYQHILSDAKEDAKHIHEDAVAAAEHEKAEILAHAKKEIADIVVDATTKVVGSKTGADIDSELYDKFLGKAGE